MSRSKHQTLKSIALGLPKETLHALAQSNDWDYDQLIEKTVIKAETKKRRRAAKLESQDDT